MNFLAIAWLLFSWIFCAHCNSTVGATSSISELKNQFHPLGNTWEGLWNNYYGYRNLNARDGHVNFVDDHQGDSEPGAGSHVDGNVYQLPGPGNYGHNQHYPQNQAGATAYHYQIIPAGSPPSGSGHYPPPISNGWGPSGGQNQGHGLNLGGIENILHNFRLDDSHFSTLFSSLFGVLGIKGVLVILKLGFFFLFVAVPLLLFITVPLSALLVIIILSLPVPVWAKVRSFPRSLASSSERLVKEAIFVDDCLEVFACNLSRMSKKYGKESLAKLLTQKVKSFGKESWSKRFIQGIEASESACGAFKCSPTKVFKNVMTKF